MVLLGTAIIRKYLPISKRSARVRPGHLTGNSQATIMTSDSIFESASSLPTDSAFPSIPPSRRSSGTELILLFFVCSIVIINGVLAVAHSTTGWVVCYLNSVVIGVPLLGFHTQNVLHRFERVGHVVTTTAKSLRIALVLGLITPALIVATRLAVEWSS